MSETKFRWFFYTFVIAIVPFLVRFLLNLTTNISPQILTISDLVAFSLVMQVSTMGAAETLNDQHKKFKTVCFSITTVLILFSGLYYALYIVSEKNPEIMNLNSSIKVLFTICASSTILSFTAHHKLQNNAKLSMEEV
ncbi:hypothetical protein [Enterobacter cloacae]|uniref:hypothetical protein n=1 Tax=Enterobacter cloacae TaxID=550 RepID=UPI0020036D56|nr:hypothetical protein [Enterobacter cloacae]MCK7315662.1 hypothetical protein [Enterobacter cloacae]